MWLLIGACVGVIGLPITKKLIADRTNEHVGVFYIYSKYAWSIWASLGAVGLVIIHLTMPMLISKIEYSIVLLICLSLTAVDMAIKKIPNQLLLALIIVKLVSIAINFSQQEITQGLIGLIIGYVIFVLPLGLKKFVGAGDIKFAAVIGMYLGYQGFFQAMLIMGILSVLLLVVLKITKRGGMKTNFPMGPFLAIGFLVSALFPIFTNIG